MANKTLTKAKAAKNDEFYTQFYDIETEMEAYLDYNRDVFRGKTVLLPCDDPEWSNFTRYFAQNFEALGLRKLISTSYAPESKTYKCGYQLSLFETESPKFDKEKTKTHGKIFILTEDTKGDGVINLDDLQWDYLEGDGDFRSKEVTRLRDEADIIITNPPFSLFREFFTWVMDAEKKFIVIANKNCTTYKEVFPHIINNQVWSGYRRWSGGMWFETKNEKNVDKIVHGVNMKNVPTMWLTNVEHGRRHQSLRLMTIEENKRFSVHKEINGKGYTQYDNYDAIEVNYYDAIPSDYDGIMGVSVTYLDKYCPEQFEIVGITKTWYGMANKVYPKQTQVDKKGKKSEVTKLNDGAVIEIDGPLEDETYYIVDGKYYKQMYARVLIRKRK